MMSGSRSPGSTRFEETCRPHRIFPFLMSGTSPRRLVPRNPTKVFSTNSRSSRRFEHSYCRPGESASRPCCSFCLTSNSSARKNAGMRWPRRNSVFNRSFQETAAVIFFAPWGRLKIIFVPTRKDTLPTARPIQRRLSTSLSHVRMGRSSRSIAGA